MKVVIVDARGWLGTNDGEREKGCGYIIESKSCPNCASDGVCCRGRGCLESCHCIRSVLRCWEEVAGCQVGDHGLNSIAASRVGVFPHRVAR